MKPIKFKGSNVVYGERQKEYFPLPGFIDHQSKEGIFVSCWKLSFWERIRALFTGKIWVSKWTFHGALQPTLLTTKMTDVLTYPEDEKGVPVFTDPPEPPPIRKDRGPL